MKSTRCGHVEYDAERVSEFCRRWRVLELSLFGSVLRNDFRPESDVDVLVSLDPGALWSLWDFIDMRNELCAMPGRNVDLLEKSALQNPFRRHEILTTQQVDCAA